MLNFQVAFKNQKIKPTGERSVHEALDLLKDTYASAGERDIMTGDSVECMVRLANQYHSIERMRFSSSVACNWSCEINQSFTYLQIITAGGVTREVFELKKD